MANIFQVSSIHLKLNGYTLTHCILIDSSTVICWTSPFAILGVSGLFCHFYTVFVGKSC